MLNVAGCESFSENAAAPRGDAIKSKKDQVKEPDALLVKPER